jgi:putative transposase
MPRRKLLQQGLFPYHVTIRSNNKDWFKIPLFEMWELSYECLLHAHKKVPVKIHCFVLMNNHYHLLVTSPNSDLPRFMEYFNRRLSQRIRMSSGARNHKFANRYAATVVDSKAYLYSVYRYIYQNPVRAKLCQQCIDYPYTSLRFSQMQIKKLELTVHVDYFQHRKWMEYRSGGELEQAIRNCLKRPVFKITSATRRFIRNKIEEVPLK